MSEPIRIPGYEGLYLSGQTIVYRFGDRYLWSKYAKGQEAEAARARAGVKRAQKANTEIFGENSAPATGWRYCKERFFPRRRDTVEDWKKDENALSRHVLSFKVGGRQLGDFPLRDIRPRHLIDCFLEFRKKLKPSGEPYAPKSIWNTYALVKALFRDARKDELVFESPCVLDERDLGPNVDANPEWRDGAIYTREELELLMFSPIIPYDRRVWYAILGVGTPRTQEAAGLRWRHWDHTAKPLGSLLIARQAFKDRTKTKIPKKMPVHPVLAAILTEWKLHGWPKMMGRHPQPDDLIIPVSGPEATNHGRGPRLRLGAARTEKYISNRTKKDLAALGLRHRRIHDLRATFITEAIIDGANETHLQACTHTAKKKAAFDAYNRIPWAAKCAAVACFKINTATPARGEVIPLAVAVGAGKTSEESVSTDVTLALPNGPNMLIINENKSGGGGNRTLRKDGRSWSFGAVSDNQNSRLAHPGDKQAAVRGRLRHPQGNGVTSFVAESLERLRDEWESNSDSKQLRHGLLALLAELEGEQ